MATDDQTPAAATDSRFGQLLAEYEAAMRERNAALDVVSEADKRMTEAKFRLADAETALDKYHEEAKAEARLRVKGRL